MISVAMTSYNGEKYITKQIESILQNLSAEDELVISDDGSTDNTIRIIEGFRDTRIKLVHGSNQGINKNFENAIQHCKGSIIFLADQDDLWYVDKVKKVLAVFESQKCVLVSHDAVVTDGIGHVLYPSFFEIRRVRTGFLKNFIRNSYHGCCMAFSAEIKNAILPIPKGHFFHDQWIGLIAELKGKCVFLEEKLMEYKRYENNASSFTQHPLHIQLRNRVELLMHLLKWWVFANKFSEKNTGQR